MPTRDPLYSLWWTMRRRCERPRPREAARYQGRGIVVCDRWKSFENFKADMSPRPPGTTLDRIDNSGPYSPENCRWATPLQQANNTRQNRPISMFGKTLNLNQWARELDINQTVIRKVLRKHQDTEEAILNFLGVRRQSLGGTGPGNPPAEAGQWVGNVAGPQLEKRPVGECQPGVLIDKLSIQQQ